MYKSLKKHLLPLSLLILISIIVHHVWFFNLAPITYGDWSIDYIERVREYISLPSIWVSDNTLGNTNFGIFFWPLLYIAGLLSKVIISSPFIERLIFLWIAALIPPISIYFLLNYLLRSRLSSFLGGIVFLYNTIFIILRTASPLLYISMGFVPLFLLFFIKALESNNFKFVITSSLFGFLVSLYEIRVFYIALWLLLFYFLFYIFIESPNQKLNINKYIYALIMVIIPIILNLYGFLGLLSLQSLTSNEIFNRNLFGTWYLNLLYILSLFQFDWTGGQITPWTNASPPFRFYFIPIIATLGLLFTKNKKIIFFGILAFIMALLTKLDHYPFPYLYQWLYDNLPGFNAFRESGKFIYFLILSYSVLIATFIKYLLKKSGKDKKRMVFNYLTILSIAFLFLWNTKPVITGELGTLYVKRSIPIDYLNLKNRIMYQQEFFRTLWVPVESQWSLTTILHPSLNNYSLNQTAWANFARKFTGNIFGVNFNNQILDLTSIKYIVIPLEDKENDDNFFRYTGNRDFFIKQIETLDYLKKVNLGTKKILVYENFNYRPRIYITYKKESIDKNIDFKNIEFSSISQTQYNVNVKNIKNPFYINFTDAYHPSWKIRMGDLNWLYAIINKNYFLPDDLHFENAAKLNSFYINPKDICSKNKSKCVMNSDGSYNIKLVIYFKPQSYVYLGLIPSGLTLLTTVSLLVYLKNKKN